MSCVVGYVNPSLKEAKEQEKNILKQMAELGVTPATIREEIARLETEIEAMIEGVACS